MQSSRNLLLAFAAVALIGTSIGCYTMLKHPRVQTDDRTAAAHENAMVGFTDDCSGCHNPGSLRAHHAVVPPPRRVVSQTWVDYYDTPWWIPYYTPVGPGGANAAAEEQKKRSFDKRHLSRPDESAPASVNSPASAPGPGTVAKPADSGTSQPASPTQDTNKREEKRSGDSQGGERRTRKPQ